MALGGYEAGGRRSASTGALHSGHTATRRSHGSAHARWYVWPHPSRRHSSPGSSAVKQMAHSGGASSVVVGFVGGKCTHGRWARAASSKPRLRVSVSSSFHSRSNYHHVTPVGVDRRPLCPPRTNGGRTRFGQRVAHHTHHNEDGACCCGDQHRHQWHIQGERGPIRGGRGRPVAWTHHEKGEPDEGPTQLGPRDAPVSALRAAGSAATRGGGCQAPPGAGTATASAARPARAAARSPRRARTIRATRRTRPRCTLGEGTTRRRS